MNNVLKVLFWIVVVAVAVCGVWLLVLLWQKFGMTAKLVTPAWQWLHKKAA